MIEDPQLGAGSYSGTRSASLKKTQFASRGGIPGAGASSSFADFGEPAMVHRGTDVHSKSQAIRPRHIKTEGYFLHKVVLITGASSGIGRALAYWYLNNGARVAIIGRDIREMDRIA